MHRWRTGHRSRAQGGLSGGREMLSCAKARATGSQTCTRRSGLRAMTCPSVTADVGNMLHRARPRWAIAKFCADILANRVGGGSPGCRGGGGGCVSGCVGHCGLGAGYVARYAAVVFRVSRYVYVSVDVAVRDCATVCTGRPNLERTQCTTLHIRHSRHSAGLPVGAAARAARRRRARARPGPTTRCNTNIGSR